MRVLVVEDMVPTRELLLYFLTKSGVIADGVGTYGEAEKRLSATAYDFVILDNDLPDGSGLQLVRPAHESGARVIMATADGHSEIFRKQAKAYGASVVFPKPYAAQEIVAYIQADAHRGSSS